MTAKIFVAPVDGSSPPIELYSASAPSRPPSLSNLRFTPDGSRVVFLGPLGLTSVAADGSSPAVSLGAADIADFQFAQGGRVVFAYQGSLYSAPQDGSAPATFLASLGSDTSLRDCAVAGSRVAYLATFGGVREVYSVPVDGSAAPLKLNSPFVSGGDAGNRQLAVTPDGARVLYEGDAETDEVIELYSVPIDGSAPPVKLSGVLAPGGDVVTMGLVPGPQVLVLPDSSHVVFAADANSDEVFDLYCAPVDGSTPRVKLSASPGSGGGDVTLASNLVWYPRLLQDGSRVVYRADDVRDEVFELFSVAPTGGASAKLSAPLLAGRVVGDVSDYRYPDASRLVYRADVHEDEIQELSVVPVSGDAPPLRLDPVSLGGVAEYTLLADGSRVVLLSASHLKLVSLPLDGSAPMVRLDPATTHHPLTHFEVAPAGDRVVFVTDPTNAVFELFSVPVDRSTAAVRISGPMVLNGDVTDSPDGHRISPDGARVAYLADQNTNGVQELYSTPIDGSAAPVKLSGTLVTGGNVSPGFGITADSSRAVFLADAVNDAVIELFSASLDGSGARVRLSGSMTTGGNVTHFAQSSASNRVVFRADRLVNDRFELFSAPLDGSASPVNLSGTLIAAGDVSVDFLIAPDGSRVVYRADALVDGADELFSAPLDGSAAPVRLNPALASGSVPSDYRFDGPSLVLFRAEALAAGVQELFRVASDASSPPVRLNAVLVSGGDVLGFDLSPDGRRVLYLADQLQDGRNELFQREVVGGLPAQRASAPLVPGGNVTSFRFGPDGRTYAYLADQDALGVFEVYLGRLPVPKIRPR